MIVASTSSTAVVVDGFSSARLILAAAVLVVAAISAQAAESTSPIGSWLAKHCGDCHANGSKEGDVSLEGVDTFASTAPETWGKIYEQLQLELMPPPDSEQPSAAERTKVLKWIRRSMQASGHHVVDKLSLPNYGNYVSHELLFRGPAHPAPATPARVWRLRPDVYVKRNPRGTQPFSLSSGQQIADFASLYDLDDASTEVIFSNAQAFVDEMVAGPYAKLLDPKSKPDIAPVRDAIKGSYTRALGRVPQADELQEAVDLFGKVEGKYGRDRALRAALTYPFLLPEAYYRLEIGEGKPDKHGRRRLAKEAIVLAITQTLFGNSGPPRLTAVLADTKATLKNKEEVSTLVRELLDAEKPGQINPRVLQFFREYFNYPKAIDIFKEPPTPLRGAYVASGLVDETSQLVNLVVAEDRDVFRRLLTTRQAFVSGRVEVGRRPPDGMVYNLPPDSTIDGLVSLDPEARCGILTQPAWLAAHSLNFDNDPVRRGKWVLEHLLGGTVPDVPVTVCAVVPEDPAKTLRERLSMTSDNAYCWKCHRQMNQLGLSFEAYDHFGRHRLHEINRPVNASGAVVDSGDPSLDGPVKDAVELIERLANSKRAEEMFVRYAFRFFIGRNETLRDAATLREAHEAYVKSEGSMKALVTELLASDSFLYRFEETASLAGQAQ